MEVTERKLTDAELKRREEIAKDLPDDEFKKRYGDKWMQVKMATATKMLKKESNVTIQKFGSFVAEKYGMKTSKKEELSAAQKKEIDVDDDGDIDGADFAKLRNKKAKKEKS